MDSTATNRAIQAFSSSYSDEYWQKYVAAYRREWDERTDKDVFLSYFHDEELALVLSWHFDDKAMCWFEGHIPVLYGASPKDLWEAGDDGIRTLKAIIMTLPC